MSIEQTTPPTSRPHSLSHHRARARAPGVLKRFHTFRKRTRPGAVCQYDIMHNMQHAHAHAHACANPQVCSLNISVSFYIASSACLREPVFALCVSVDCATSPLLASPAFTLVIAALPCVTSDRCGAVTKTSCAERRVHPSTCGLTSAVAVSLAVLVRCWCAAGARGTSADASVHLLWHHASARGNPRPPRPGHALVRPPRKLSRSSRFEAELPSRLETGHRWLETGHRVVRRRRAESQHAAQAEANVHGQRPPRRAPVCAPHCELARAPEGWPVHPIFGLAAAFGQSHDASLGAWTQPP